REDVLRDPSFKDLPGLLGMLRIEGGYLFRGEVSQPQGFGFDVEETV
ncbi:MAG: hypothetical protein, partial [Olavius algarvensis Gamma 1 endosymbiont]